MAALFAGPTAAGLFFSAAGKQ
jgi:hypothetical protein